MKKRIVNVILTATLCFSVLTTTFCFGQSMLTTTTKYSRTDNGSIGQENFSFSLSSNTFTIIDLDYNRSETYGPVKLSHSGFEDKYYYETYTPDVDQDPAHWQKWTNNIRNYQLVFDQKGGNLIYIVEAKTLPNKDKTTKVYYTEQGYSPSGTGYNQTNKSSNLADLLLKANNLNEIASSIKMDYTSDMNKKYSNDNNSYSINFDKGKNRAIISYMVSENKIFQIIYLLPKDESTEISNNSFKTHFTEKTIDGNSAWVNLNSGLMFSIVYNGDIGIIVVKN